MPLLLLRQADISQQETHLADQQREEQGMYRNLKTRQLFLLTECLMKSHRFARNYNAENEAHSKTGKIPQLCELLVLNQSSNIKENGDNMLCYQNL